MNCSLPLHVFAKKDGANDGFPRVKELWETGTGTFVRASNKHQQIRRDDASDQRLVQCSLPTARVWIEHVIQKRMAMELIMSYSFLVAQWTVEMCRICS